MLSVRCLVPDRSEVARLACVNEQQLAAVHGVCGDVADQDLDRPSKAGRCEQFFSVVSSILALDFPGHECTAVHRIREVALVDVDPTRRDRGLFL